MFDRASRPTITESVVESADSAVESADYWSRPTGNWPSVKYFASFRENNFMVIKDIKTFHEFHAIQHQRERVPFKKC